MPERAYIDRIEGDRARLLFGAEGRETGSIPARLLPPGAREGDAVEVTLSPATGDRTREEVRALMQDLFQEP